MRQYDDRIADVKLFLAVLLRDEDFQVDMKRIDNDLWVSGPLSELMEFCRENRSEIEELG